MTTTEIRRGRIEREIHVYTQRERETLVCSMYSISFDALSLSHSLFAFLYSPSSFCIRICKHGYDVTCKNQKKIEHAHSLETVVERDSVCVCVCTSKQTNIHTHISDVFISRKIFSKSREENS